MSYTELSASHPKARKEYRCDWCNEAILVGEKHFYRTYIFEGTFTADRMHLECEQAMDAAPRDEIAEGWMPGENPRGKYKPAC